VGGDGGGHGQSSGGSRETHLEGYWFRFVGFGLKDWMKLEVWRFEKVVSGFGCFGMNEGLAQPN
jgi:hypothetical protein